MFDDLGSLLIVNSLSSIPSVLCIQSLLPLAVKATNVTTEQFLIQLTALVSAILVSAFCLSHLPFHDKHSHRLLHGVYTDITFLDFEEIEFSDATNCRHRNNAGLLLTARLVLREQQEINIYICNKNILNQ